MNSVLVTGARGFVGRHLCNSLAASGCEVIGATRSIQNEPMPSGYRLQAVGDIGSDVDWQPVLKNVDCVVHLAARVHVMSEVAGDPLAEFRRVNYHGSEMLAKSAAEAGVRRLIYVSTIKVLGEMTDGYAFGNTDRAAPCDPYAVSKFEAEEALKRIAKEKELEIVILRPPLVYGPGVGGNFLRLLRMVDKGIPLPFGSIRNKRSLVSVNNLCDLIRKCMENAAAVGKTFLISDNDDISTPKLVELIADSMSRPVRLLHVPAPMLRVVARLVGRSNDMVRLLGSLQARVDETMSMLDWQPTESVEEGIRATVRWYLER